MKSWAPRFFLLNGRQYGLVVRECLRDHSVIPNIQGPSWRMNESKKLNSSSKSKHTKIADPQ